MDVLKVVESYYDTPEAYFINDKLVGTVHCNDRYEIKPLLINIMREYNVTETLFFALSDDGEDFIADNDYEYPEDFREIAGLVDESE